SAFYHCFSVLASSIFVSQITLVFAVSKMPVSPHLHVGNKTLPFLKKSQPYISFPSPVGSRKNVFFRQAKRVLLLMCQFLKFSSWISTNRWSIPAIYH